MSGLEKSILEAAERPLHDKDPDGTEPRRTPSPTLSAKGDTGLSLDALQLSHTSRSVGYPTTAQGHQTGPKGVLADYAASKRGKAASWSVEDMLARDEADQADEEDGFVSEWRRKRLDELRSGGSDGAGEPAKKAFGQFREIGLANFERAVLQEDPEVKVVLHLFEAHLPACLVLNLHLSNLAHEHVGVKFLRAQASELDFATGSDDVLPTILVYQGAELVANLVAVDLAWGRRLDYDEQDLKDVLVEHGVLPRDPPATRPGLQDGHDASDDDERD